MDIYKLTGYVLLLVLLGCKSDKKVNHPTLDLLKHGFSVSVDAPEGAEIHEDDLGIMKELTIKLGDHYYLEILKSEATNNNVGDIISEQLEIIKSGPYPIEVIKEYDDGFVYQKTIGDMVTYDFKKIKVQGADEYIFQTGLIGKFTLDDVNAMYKSIK